MANDNPVGVLGAGSFGAVVSNLLAKNRTVYLYTRRQEVVDEILQKKAIRNMPMHERIKPTTDLEQLVKTCRLIFPVVRSAHFRQMIRNLSPFLEPDHMLIHGTKGLDITSDQSLEEISSLRESQIKTMSEVILEESVVKRVGCFSGPNLAKEIAKGDIAGAVIASRFNDVIDEGKRALGSDLFRTYPSNDIKGVELTGALKNIMALASGILDGLGFGNNARSMLIARGLSELIWIGKTLGGHHESFLGLAGIGDLVATCSSENSRNFTVGKRVAQGERLQDILDSMHDVVEGLDTTRIVNALVNHYKLRAPISQTLHKILFEDQPIKESIEYLMSYPVLKDVDFL